MEQLLLELQMTMIVLKTFYGQLLSGTALPGDAAADGRGVVVGTTAQNGSQCTFAKSDVHELMKLNLFFRTRKYNIQVE